MLQPWAVLPARALPRARGLASVAASSRQQNDPSVIEGHIAVGPDEALIYVDNVFPIKYATWDFRNWANRLAIASPVQQTLSAILTDTQGTVRAVYPRYKDGGEYVKLALHGAHDRPELARSICEQLTSRSLAPWFNPLSRIRAFVVKVRAYADSGCSLSLG